MWGGQRAEGVDDACVKKGTGGDRALVRTEKKHRAAAIGPIQTHAAKTGH